MFKLEFVLSCGGDEDWFSGGGFVFVVRAVACLLGFFRALVNEIQQGVFRYRLNKNSLLLRTLQ